MSKASQLLEKLNGPKSESSELDATNAKIAKRVAASNRLDELIKKRSDQVAELQAKIKDVNKEYEDKIKLAKEELRAI